MYFVKPYAWLFFLEDFDKFIKSEIKKEITEIDNEMARLSKCISDEEDKINEQSQQSGTSLTTRLYLKGVFY